MGAPGSSRPFRDTRGLRASAARARRLFESLMQQVTLNNGLAMPLLGFGVFQITDAAAWLGGTRTIPRDR